MQTTVKKARLTLGGRRLRPGRTVPHAPSRSGDRTGHFSMPRMHAGPESVAGPAAAIHREDQAEWVR
jgi:hypothetical protein